MAMIAKLSCHEPSIVLAVRLLSGNKGFDLAFPLVDYRDKTGIELALATAGFPCP